MQLDREQQENCLAFERNQVCLKELWQQILNNEAARKREKIRLRSNEPAVLSRVAFPATDEATKFAAKRAACLENALALKDQCRRKQEYKCLCAAADAEFDAAVLASVRCALEQDAERACENKKILHKESEQYLQYLRDVNHERMLADAERDKIIEEHNQNENAKLWGKSCLVIRQRREFAQTVYAERWQQIEENRKRREEEHARLFLEGAMRHESAARELQEEQECLKRKYLQQRMFANELLIQANEVNVAKVIYFIFIISLLATKIVSKTYRYRGGFSTVSKD